MERARIGALLVTAARMSLGVVFLWAGIPKAVDPPTSIAAVAAYRLLPGWAEELVGITLPWAEIAVGVLLVVGLASRLAAVAAAALIVTFTAGMVSAWARGLPIDCGCFGETGPGDGIGFVEIGRDVAFLALAVLAIAWSRNGWGVDRWLER